MYNKHFTVFLVILNCLFVLVANCWHHQCSCHTNNVQELPKRSPVILIPGLGGNRLQAKLNKPCVSNNLWKQKFRDYISIWMNLKDFMTSGVDRLMDRMTLDYDDSSRTSRNSAGVSIRVPHWGDPKSVEFLDEMRIVPYFNSIAKMLVHRLGYKRNLSLRAAPYDFRKGPSESYQYFASLKNLIEETYMTNDDTRVTLIAHSMGAAMTLILLQNQSEEWKDKYVESFISLGGAWGGSMKSLKAVTSGDDLSYPKFIKPEEMKGVLGTFTSLAFLLPSNLFWDDDELLVSTPYRDYRFGEMKDLLFDVNNPNAWESYLDNEKFRLDFGPPGVEVHCLHGVDVPTIERLRYEDDPNYSQPSVEMGDGDGTVNLRSLQGCAHWRELRQSNLTMHDTHYRTFSKVNHGQILKDAEVLNYIKSVLY